MVWGWREKPRIGRRSRARMGGLVEMADGPEMKCSVDEWLKTEGFEECVGGYGCGGEGVS